jgi:hypothetical protein
MNDELNTTRLEFGSLLTYSPRGISQDEEDSRTWMRRIKDDEVLQNPPIATSQYICNLVRTNINKLAFHHFFEGSPILIPIPNSSFMQPSSLWVPRRLAEAMVRMDLGTEVIDALLRVHPLRKAATSSPENRPKARDHYHSLEVRDILSHPEEIILVDDIVTRRSTMLGAANRLKRSFPEARIRGFAAMRTMSPPFILKNIMDPCIGEITLNGEDTFRKP